MKKKTLLRSSSDCWIYAAMAFMAIGVCTTAYLIAMAIAIYWGAVWW